MDLTFEVKNGVAVVTPNSGEANDYLKKNYAKCGYKGNFAQVAMEEKDFMAFSVGCMSSGLSLQQAEAR